MSGEIGGWGRWGRDPGESSEGRFNSDILGIWELAWIGVQYHSRLLRHEHKTVGSEERAKFSIMNTAEVFF